MTVSDLAPDRLDESPAGGRIPPVARKRLKGAFIGFGLFLWVMSGAMGGVKGATVAAVVSVLVAAGLAARPGIAQWLLVDSPTADVPPTRRSVFLVDLAERATGSRMREAVTASARTPVRKTSETPSIRVRYRDGCMVARCAHSASNSAAPISGKMFATS